MALQALHDGALEGRVAGAPAFTHPRILQRLRRRQPLARVPLQQPLRATQIPVNPQGFSSGLFSGAALTCRRSKIITAGTLTALEQPRAGTACDESISSHLEEVPGRAGHRALHLPGVQVDLLRQNSLPHLRQSREQILLVSAPQASP